MAVVQAASRRRAVEHVALQLLPGTGPLVARVLGVIVEPVQPLPLLPPGGAYLMYDASGCSLRRHLTTLRNGRMRARDAVCPLQFSACMRATQCVLCGSQPRGGLTPTTGLTRCCGSMHPHAGQRIIPAPSKQETAHPETRANDQAQHDKGS